MRYVGVQKYTGLEISVDPSVVFAFGPHIDGGTLLHTNVGEFHVEDDYETVNAFITEGEDFDDHVELNETEDEEKVVLQLRLDNGEVDKVHLAACRFAAESYARLLESSGVEFYVVQAQTVRRILEKIDSGE